MSCISRGSSAAGTNRPSPLKGDGCEGVDWKRFRDIVLSEEEDIVKLLKERGGREGGRSVRVCVRRVWREILEGGWRTSFMKL